MTNAAHAQLAQTYRTARARLNAADAMMAAEIEGFTAGDSMTRAEAGDYLEQLETKHEILALSLAYDAARDALSDWALDNMGTKIAALQPLRAKRNRMFVRERVAEISAQWDGLGEF